MQKAGYTSVMKYLNEQQKGWKFMEGFMFRYIKILDPAVVKNYTVLPYSEIERLGGKMYLGEALQQKPVKRLHVKLNVNKTETKK